jgi:glycosyltransferase involved in cell wall biosynthesis
MMKKFVYIANKSQQKLGGGFIFLDNLRKGSNGICNFVDKWEDSHIFFIPSATMAVRDEAVAAKKAKKRIVLRIDNMPKDSRNRGTAFSRMRDFAQMADVIIFQSEWCRQYVGEYLEMSCKVNLSKSHVIYNGVDSEIFFHKDNPKTRGETYIFTTFNTDENKRFPEAAYDFHQRHKKAKKEGNSLPHLKLVGNFSKDIVPYNFDFFDGEKVTYSPPIDNRKNMADAFRSCQYIYFPAFADAAPNTVSEAIACGCKVLLANPIGGTAEVIKSFSQSIFTIQDMADKYLKAF